MLFTPGFQGTQLGNNQFFSKSVTNLETINVLKTPHLADGESETTVIIAGKIGTKTQVC